MELSIPGAAINLALLFCFLSLSPIFQIVILKVVHGFMRASCTAQLQNTSQLTIEIEPTKFTCVKSYLEPVDPIVGGFISHQD